MPDGALERMLDVLKAYKLINMGYAEWMDIMVAAENATTTKISGVSKFYRYALCSKYNVERSVKIYGLVAPYIELSPRMKAELLELYGGSYKPKPAAVKPTTW